MSATGIDTRPIFALCLRFIGKPAENGINSLRAVLKQLRHRGFICLDAHEELTEEKPS
jgi:hypothetical protein